MSSRTVRNLGIAALGAMALTALSGCHQTNNGDDLLWFFLLANRPINNNPSTPSTPQPYIGWYNSYGQRCGSLGPGCNYYSSGNKITVNQDPYYTSSSGWSYYYSYTYGRNVEVSPTGIVYDQYYGTALNVDNAVDDGKDIVSDVALAQEKRMENTAKYFAQKFTLSDEQGLKVAQTLNEYLVLEKRSVQDVQAFTQQMYGLSLNTLMSAAASAQKGDLSGVQAAVQTASQHLETSPESVKALVKELHGNLLAEQGIKF